MLTCWRMLTYAGEVQAFMRHFYERLSNVSDIAPYSFPPRNYSLTGEALEKAIC